MTGHCFAIFDTPIGRCGIVWGARGITGVQLPMGSEDKTRIRIRQGRGELTEAPPPAEVQSAIDGIVELLAGKPFSAAEAHAWGLVNEVFPLTDLLRETLATASRIARNAPISVRQAKLSIHRGLQSSLRDGLALEIEAYNRMVPTEDRREGVLAFNEKRPPDFKGR